MLTTEAEAGRHRVVTSAVHGEGGKIALQILHTGRYSYQPGLVAPSAIRAPINPFVPHALSGEEVEQTIEDYARCAALAQHAGYDGVEVMGSEGYLINEFIAARTNRREDEWGGAYENRYPAANRDRPAHPCASRAGSSSSSTGCRCSISVDGGSTREEVIRLGKAIEAAGATIINTGIGWHEARIPTIAACVPRAAFAWVTKILKGEVSIPLIATNRINTPEVAERLLVEGIFATWCRWRGRSWPIPHFVRKARENRADEINTCIACNQACLDQIFGGKIASCLVNPRACHETELDIAPAAKHPSGSRWWALAPPG